MSNDPTLPERKMVLFTSWVFFFLGLLLQIFTFYEQVISKNSPSYEYGSVGDEFK